MFAGWESSSCQKLTAIKSIHRSSVPISVQVDSAFLRSHFHFDWEATTSADSGSIHQLVLTYSVLLTARRWLAYRWPKCTWCLILYYLWITFQDTNFNQILLCIFLGSVEDMERTTVVAGLWAHMSSCWLLFASSAHVLFTSWPCALHAVNWSYRVALFFSSSICLWLCASHPHLSSAQ